ncbi:hypothetical protein BaRGS_00010979 [Batillaria attramentaria]|uniref:Cytochrome P450 n=1 Tax=Batillaria attramentaria TaxID=370345 RepID=A0ABD0LES2_9CAEN
MELVTLGLILFLTTSLLLAIVTKSAAPRKLPPGPKGLHSLRLLLRAALSGTLHLEAEKWSKQYGDLVLIQTPAQNLVFLNSSRLIRRVYAEKGREGVTNDRPKTFSGWWAMYGNNDIILGSPTSTHWARLRKLFHSSIRFYGDGVERFESTVQVELRRLIDRLGAMTTVDSRERTPASVEVDLSNLMSYSLLCVLGVLLTGDCPEPDSDLVHRIKQFDHDANTLFNPSVDGVLTAFPFLRFLPCYYGHVVRDVTSSRQRLLDTLFTEAKASHAPGHPRGIVDILFDEQLKPDGHWLSDQHIQCVIMDTVITAYLTSRETLLDLFLYLLHFPEVMRRIQKEVDHAIGQRMPRIEDRGNLPYTEAAILEVLRHSSFIPLGIPHECRDDVTVDDVHISKGSMLFANTWVCHHDPEVWGDPGIFRPERFLDDVTGQVLPATHPLRQNLLSFGAGKRSCPGENFARTRVFLYVTTLLQKFDILPPAEHELLPLERGSWNSGAMLNLKPYHCVFQERR